MYVILDLEWVFKKGQAFPTQIAAARVDGSWNIIDTYSSLIAPPHGQAFDFTQVGYSGHEKEEFENAKCAQAVFCGLQKWFLNDDILCWWHEDSEKFFKKCCLAHTGRVCHQISMILNEHIYAYLCDENKLPKNPYRMARCLGIQVPGLIHESMNDVKTITLLLMGINFRPQYLTKPFVRVDGGKSEPLPAPYLIDVRHGIIHERGCERLLPGSYVAGYQQLDSCIRRKFMPCKCCEAEYKAAYRRHNEAIITKSQYNYIFTSDSKVFHRYTCGCMKLAKTVLGTVNYDSAFKTGRTPCKLCHPSPNDIPRQEAYTDKKSKSKQQSPNGTRSRKEELALARYEQARKDQERLSSGFSAMDEVERRDYLTLTQTSNMFWAASGYRSFHTRTCKKLKDMKGLRGFSRYADATRAGYTPCKCCKPTAKMDSAVSIPIYSKEREDDTVEVLEGACRKHGFAFSFTAPYFTFETPVGIWRIDTGSKPYSLYHINLAMTPDNKDNFHRQPKIFLSLLDVFHYIRRHDLSLQEKTQSEIIIACAAMMHTL